VAVTLASIGGFLVFLAASSRDLFTVLALTVWALIVSWAAAVLALAFGPRPGVLARACITLAAASALGVMWLGLVA